MAGSTLVFSHKSDIDGMGGVVLANLAFEDVDYVLCETFKLQEEMKKFYDDGSNIIMIKFLLQIYA